MAETVEELRLAEDRSRSANWKRWGPYLSERQWGTVREDYSADGSCWEYLSHDQARSRAYRWGEDGLLGITDRQCRLCFALALWNGRDPILKERLFGLTGPEGNHGEDCKECYYYLDSTPTHSYMKALYKYPQSAYPYEQLVATNRERGIENPEFELEDTGAFQDSRYWDVSAEYAKSTPNNLLIRVTVSNRGPEDGTIHVIPTLWFRNTWSWGCTHEGCTMKPRISREGPGRVRCTHDTLLPYHWEVADVDGRSPELLFTENETNFERLYGGQNRTPFVKDSFHDHVINGKKDCVNPKGHGTKVGAHYVLHVKAGESVTLDSRLFQDDEAASPSLGEPFDAVFSKRKAEADAFYARAIPARLNAEETNVARQGLAGLLWTKQFYHYVIKDWLEGDPEQPPPPPERRRGRNNDWMHLFNRDVISMPDKWEYPWYASWDLAFHMVPFALVDVDFAKGQLMLFLREWYMHPNGQIPAYEFAFDDVNPPVHAWAVRKVFKGTGPRKQRDTKFLARCFQKLMLNFTWWVNRKDPRGKNIFSGGFLGLDNIGIFDRSKPLPIHGQLEQADGTAWMAFYCVVMLDIALELAEVDATYEDMASKFFEHFIHIMDAINSAGQGEGLWDEQDGFYYDFIRTESGCSIPLRVRSMVGLIPLFACLVLEGARVRKLTGFWKRTQWFMQNRKDLFGRVAYMTSSEDGLDNFLLGIPTEKQLVSVLRYLLDEEEFLSPYGVRSLSKKHKDHPFVISLNGERYSVPYVSGESNTHLFGGNSNWRGPIWLCVNFLLIEALDRYYFFYGKRLTVECPVGSGRQLTLREVACELAARLIRLFVPGEDGRRPCHGNSAQYAEDPFWRDLVLFYEYFDGDSGRGCGASHQTGWTSLIVNCLMMKLGVRHAGLAWRYDAQP
ncbi:uncharacterized protein YMR196W-like [Pollicipes pollicipes]|uniref:uncharacterized protein YMR196W-like n=1 Tax=Pollicipes pollicipes TaxID=41117 RepID=UPI001884DDB4|nr:uncharacterized protein YMR196W-like [Pollicipes pollicipes]